MRTYLTFVLLVFATSPAWADPASVTFKVEIAINRESLDAESYKTYGVFFVETKVLNISDRDQEIIVWTQHGWSWLSSSPKVKPGIEAKKNEPSRITLKSNQDYVSKVAMWSDPHRNIKPVTFRLRFVPKAELPVSGQRVERNIVKWGGTFWSNAVTLAR